MKNPLKTILRIRFVVLSMAALLLLQGTIVSISIYHNYADMVSKSDVILSQLRQDPSSNVRYFSVKVHPGKGAIRPDVIQHVSITPQQAGAYAKAALESNQDKGFLDRYRYHIYRSDNGIRILFLSRASSIEMHRTAAKNLIWISVLSLLAVCAVLIPASGWIVMPLLENHRKQKQFITAASHQLKTPLTVISTDAQLLQAEIGDNQWVTGILQQTDHLTKMTQDLVTLSKAQEYDNPLIRENFSLSDTVQEVLNVYSGLSEDRNIRFSWSVCPEITYCGSEAEIRQLLTVLMDNAFKYCPSGGQISLSLKKEFRGAALQVINTATVMEHPTDTVFAQRFFRGENAAGTEGFGLGLSIAQAIVVRHKGKLTASAQKDGLFCVNVTLR